MHHQFETTEDRQRPITCTACGHTWPSTPRDTTGCPGVRWFAWRTAPTELKTYSQLRAAHLKPRDRQQPDGCIVVKEDWCWLFDERQALPRRCSQRKLEALAIARQRQQERWRCQHCGHVPKNPTEIRYPFLAPGVCKWCAKCLLRNTSKYCQILANMLYFSHEVKHLRQTTRH